MAKTWFLSSKIAKNRTFRKKLTLEHLKSYWPPKSLKRTIIKLITTFENSFFYYSLIKFENGQNVIFRFKNVQNLKFLKTIWNSHIFEATDLKDSWKGPNLNSLKLLKNTFFIPAYKHRKWQNLLFGLEMVKDLSYPHFSS